MAFMHVCGRCVRGGVQVWDRVCKLGVGKVKRQVLTKQVCSEGAGVLGRA